MTRIGTYLNSDFVMNSSPALLQEVVMFNIIYFFCHRGKENLYDMTKETFKVYTDYDGAHYLKQK